MKTDLGPLLGAGKEAETYAYKPGWVIKLTRWRRDHAPARREDAILRSLAPTGLAPAAGGVVEIDGRWGVVMERMDGPMLAEGLSAPDGPATVLGTMVNLHQRIHAHAAPSGLRPLKERLERNIGHTRLIDEPTRRRLLNSLTDLPDGDRVCHGDFHPYNIMQHGGEWRIVDWHDAHAGVPAADVCRTFLMISSVSDALAKSYVDAYCTTTGLDRTAVYDWLPVTAAARLAEKVPDEKGRLVALAQAKLLR